MYAVASDESPEAMLAQGGASRPGIACQAPERKNLEAVRLDGSRVPGGPGVRLWCAAAGSNPNAELDLGTPLLP